MCMSPDQMNLSTLKRHLSSYESFVNDDPQDTWAARKADEFRELITKLEKNAADAGVRPEDYRPEVTPRHPHGLM